MAHENATPHVIEDVELDLTVYDWTLALLGFDDENGVVGAVATTEDGAAVEWGRSVLDDYRARAAAIPTELA